MKVLGLTLGFLAFLMAGQVFADGHSGQLVAITADEVFVPVGFDDNDEAVTVVDGFLPNGCFRLGRPEVSFDQATGSIVVTPMARYFNVPCIETRVPFNFEVRLGVMPMGAYKVQVAGTNIEETLIVDEATNAGPDDHLYAPVDSVTVERLSGSNTYVGVLEGRFTNSCMTFEDVQVLPTGKTIQVLPKIDVAEGANCLQGIFPFKQSFILPDSVGEGRRLLHVRSLNGRDVNKLFTVSYEIN